MRKYGNFQIIGAAISTIGIMFLLITCLGYFNIVPMSGTGLGTAIVSLLMATNGYMILLYGIFSNHATAAASMAVLN